MMALQLKATGYRETEDRDGLCVSISMAVGSPVSTVYLRIKSYGQWLTALGGID